MHAVFFFACIGFLVAFLYKRSLDFPQVWVQVIIAFVFISIDGYRKDLKFILYLKNKGKNVILGEYISLLVLLEIPYCLYQLVDYYISIPILTILILVFSRYGIEKLNSLTRVEIIKPLTKLLPLHAFEWRAGIRKHKLAFCFSYILGFLLLFLFPVTPVFMLFWVAYSGEFYNFMENKEIIQSYETLKSFSEKKLRSFFLTLNLLFLPHYLLYTILDHEQDQLIILLFAIIVFNMIFTYAFLYKYKFAMLGRQQVYNSVPLMVFIFIVLIAPLSIYFIFNLWKNLKTRLNVYLK